MRLRLTLLLVLLGGLLAAVPSPALAGRGSCLAGQPGGPTCTTWTGRVTFVNDGDTITVDFDRDRSRVRRRVRFTGINAMEQTVYAASARAGECHAVEATLRLSRLIRASGNRVRLAAQASSSISRNRLKRFIAVKVRGRWRDVGNILTAEGLALWLPQRIENAGNALYRANTQRAQALGLRLFSPTACGAGPSEASPLRLWVNWDADGSDSANPDGEWVRIANDDPVNAVSLAGWWLRDSSLRRYTFPPEAVIPPGGRLEVTVGRSGDELAQFAWGRGGPVFDNVTTDGTELGDGAYLFDPLGNLRVAMIYPCGPRLPRPAAGRDPDLRAPQGPGVGLADQRVRGPCRPRGARDQGAVVLVRLRPGLGDRAGRDAHPGRRWRAGGRRAAQPSLGAGSGHPLQLRRRRAAGELQRRGRRLRRLGHAQLLSGAGRDAITALTPRRPSGRPHAAPPVRAVRPLYAAPPVRPHAATAVTGCRTTAQNW